MKNDGKEKNAGSGRKFSAKKTPDAGKNPGGKTLNPYSVAGGRAMKRLRESKNLGQGEAALEANFSLSYLSNVERGNHALSLNKFMAFSEGIHSRPEELCRLLCEEIEKCRSRGELKSSDGSADVRESYKKASGKGVLSGDSKKENRKHQKIDGDSFKKICGSSDDCLECP